MTPAIGQRWLFRNNNCVQHFKASLIVEVLVVDRGGSPYYQLKTIQLLPHGDNSGRFVGEEFNTKLIAPCECWQYLEGQDKE